ncbi:hypothetical protein J7F01_01655 [Streptomyces sp. ISL-22]|uniref:hypothetical protein n=1 Tax=unclassified Streptomyces TaxID=2593676 RepID=UPI001BEBFB8C|nr:MULTISPECIES: hypothetical protein [unclassified Streptomyces]MBT2421046.1 hypothetical protein [Streptomyces sp. ISL-24]MBT2430928.1 hypothetical protein [Streptomyces sp. ISL-22]
MPYPSPPRSPSGPRRRTLLASASGLALLVGCSSRDEDSEGATGGSPSAADRARARAARDSEGLVERYDAVLAAHPVLTEALAPLRAEVVRHVEAFGGGASAPSGSSGPAKRPSTAAEAPGDKSSPSASPSATVPGNERDALAELAAAERALADRRATALLDVPGELARLLASVAAAGAAHAFLLTEGAR